MQDLSILDPTASLVESGEPNAVLVPYGENGEHTKVVFLGDEKARLEKYLTAQITKAIDDYAPIWAKRASNIEAYEGLSAKGEAITLPMCRAQANQQHAWLMDRIFSANPVVTVNPLGDREITILKRDPDTGIASPQAISSSDEASDIEDLIQHKWSSRLPMRKVLGDWAMDAIIDGTLPSVVKIVHEKRERSLTGYGAPVEQIDPLTGQPILNEGGQKIQILNAPEHRTVVDGETVRIVNVPPETFLVPLGYNDVQSPPWIAMATEPDASTVRRKITSGDWDFCVPPGQEASEEDVNAVLFGIEDTSESPSKRGKRAQNRVDKRREINPTDRHTVYEVPFRWPIASPEDPSTIVWHECVGDFHLKSRKLLSCCLLDTWNGLRPFETFFMRQRPNSFSGTSTVEDVAPFQRYASNLFHLQVQNMVMRNLSVTKVRKGTTAARSVKSQKMRPGAVIEFDEPEDFDLKPLGTPIESIANEISFLKAGAVEMGLSTQYDTATADLSRVTAGAFAQQQDLSKMQPKQIYSAFAEAVGKLALHYLQTLIQYAPEQIIPRFDDETDAVLDEIIHLPRQMVTDEFEFTVTATSSDQTPEAQFQQDLVLNQQVDAKNAFAMAVLGQIMMPGIPPEFQRIGMFLIARSEQGLTSLLKNARRQNAAQIVITPQMIDEAITSLQQRAAMMAPTGGPNASANAGAGGAVSGAPAGVVPEGYLPVPSEQGLEGAGEAMQMPNLPA